MLGDEACYFFLYTQLFHENILNSYVLSPYCNTIFSYFEHVSEYQICYNMFYVDCIVNLLSLKILINYYMICGIYYPFISRTFKLFIYFIIPYLI